MQTIAILLRNTLLFTVATAPQAFAANTMYYLESNGIVVFESESAELVGDWARSTEVPGATGEAYIRWEGENFYPEVTAGEGVLTYNFTVETPGNYQLLWRSRITEGADDREHNDSWVRMATGRNVADEEALDNWTKAYMNTLDEWTWSTKTRDGVGNPLRQFFDAGDHTLEVSGRSFGHAIDRIVLYQYESIGFSENAFNTIPESQNTTESSSPGDSNDEEAGTGGTDSPDTPSGSETETGGTQTGNEDSEIRSVNAIELPQYAESNEQAAGECSGNRLELPTILDVHESEGRLVEANQLEIVGSQRGAFLKFDLSKVPPISEAALLYTVADNLTGGELRIDLGSDSSWNVGYSSSDAPSYLVDLAQATADWNADVRYQSMLDAKLLQPSLVSVILTLTEDGRELTLVASEDASRGPRLLLTGGSDFCDAYHLLNQDEVPAIVEPEEILPIQPDAEDTALPVVDSKAKSSGSSLSGGISLWMLMLISLSAFPRVCRRCLIRGAQSTL